MVQVKTTKNLLIQNKREWINNLLNKVKQHNSRDFCPTIRIFRKCFTSKAYRIRKISGKLLQKRKKISRYERTILEILNEKTNTEELSEQAVFHNVLQIVTEIPIEEVKSGIKEQENNKDPGQNRITSEIIKAESQII